MPEKHCPNTPVLHYSNLIFTTDQLNKLVTASKVNRLPREAGLTLIQTLRTPLCGEPPVSALIRNARGVTEWKLFLNG